jgi:hypothetical protein
MMRGLRIESGGAFGCGARSLAVDGAGRWDSQGLHRPADGGLFVCYGNLILTLRDLEPLADAPVTTCRGIPGSFKAVALVAKANEAVAEAR